MKIIQQAKDNVNKYKDIISENYYDYLMEAISKAEEYATSLKDFKHGGIALRMFASLDEKTILHYDNVYNNTKK